MNEKCCSETPHRRLLLTDCKFSDGWFSKFKARQNLKFKTSHGEAKSADSDAADKWVFKSKRKYIEIKAKF